MKIESAHKWFTRQQKKGWHKWFAWYPVKIDINTIAWLQYVERYITGMSHSDITSTATYEYREFKA